MRNKSLIMTIVLFLVTSPTWSASATTNGILKNPSIYDGKHVDISGSVQDVIPKTSRRGHDYEAFDICDGDDCLKVFTFGHPALSEGQHLAVHGTFEAVKRVGPYTFYNELETDQGSLGN